VLTLLSLPSPSLPLSLCHPLTISLQDAIKFKLSVDGHFHMSFTDSGAVFCGRSREPINSWLPLYVCADHWARVRLLMQPILGYFVCLDPLAYDK
jgi:hypothetical protein